MTVAEITVQPRSRFLLVLLGLGTFAIGIDAFVVAGVLSAISSDLSVSTAASGQLVTIFAVSYAILAPLSAWALAGWSRRNTLLLAMTVFTIGNVLSAFAVSFEVLAASRILAALGAASYTPQAVAAVSDLVPGERKGRALSIVYGGMTVATALGVPLGTLVGEILGWRATFLLIVGLGILSLAGLASVLPSLAAPGAHRLRDRLSAITQPAVLFTLSITFLAALSEHVSYSYISVILAETRWHDLPVLPIALAFFGAGAVIGNFAAGYGTDRFGNRTVIIVAVAAQSAALLALSFFQSEAGLACLALFIWGIAGWMYLVPIQHRLLELSKSYGAFTVSLNSSVLYLGIGGGGAVGGAFISFVSPSELGLLSFAIGLAALANAFLAFRTR
ncbi:MFS transporter [Ensifer aridi]|uniref:MFS transporter n=1 Tax=Ensifer aridi TaxID=1708715 RepID=UPI000A100255|nr:MFS transporter [Ensifer aridi]